MDLEKKAAILEWIKAIVEGVELTSLSEMKDHSSIILQLLSKIDPSLQYPIGTNEKNFSWICTYLKELFNEDVIEENKVQLGNELEIGKLLCLVLELTLTSSENSNHILKIQCLPEIVQTNIMSMTKMVFDNNQKFNLGDIMERKLKLSVSEETNSDEDQTLNYSIPSINKSPNQPVTPVFTSPLMPRKTNLDTSTNENTSPLAVFASSPQAIYRRMMIENRKLKQKVRHSELFLRRQTEFEDQFTQDYESEKQDLLNKNKTLLKEQDTQMQNIQDLQDTINKMKEEVEFLQLEVQTKDRELSDQYVELKKSNEIVTDMQTLLDKLSETEDALKHQKIQYDEESKKNAILTSKVNELEQSNCGMRKEMLTTKEAVESITKEMEQRKKDYSDQLSHLQDKLEKWEQKSLTQAAKSHEALSVEIQRDAEISSLKAEVKKHFNTIKVQETTIINMGYESKNIQTKKAELELQVEHLKKEIEALKQKADESTENYKTQSNQYMDQISSLLKQVTEHAQRNEGLNAKMTNTEEKCKILEQQIGKFDESERRINEHLQKRTKIIEEKDKKILVLQQEMEEKKVSIIALDVEKVKMEAKLQILAEDRVRLQEIESKHQTVLYENERLKNVENTNTILESRIESLKNTEQMYEVASNEIATLQQSLHKLTEENKEIATLKEQVNTLTDQSLGLTSSCEQQKQDLEERQKQIKLQQMEIEQLNSEVIEKVEMGKRMQELRIENESIKKTVVDYKQASTNSEINQQNLMKEVEESRKIEAENKSLAQIELQLNEKVKQLQESLSSSQGEIAVLREEKETALKEFTRLQLSVLEQSKLQKEEKIKLEEMNSTVQEVHQKNEVLTKGLIHQKKEKETREARLQESLTKVECLQQEITTLKESRDKDREEIQNQQQKLTELREVEIQCKIIQSENTALQSVSENLKNLSFAYEKSEQKCQVLRQEINDLDQIRVHNTELKCQNITMEVELKDGAVKRGQLTNEIADLKSHLESLKTQHKMQLVTKNKLFEDEINSLNNEITNCQTKVSQLDHENVSLQQSINHFTKLQEDWKLNEQKLMSELTSQKSLKETDKNNHFKDMEVLHINEMEEKNKTIGDLLQKLDQWKDAHDDQLKCSERLEALNKEILVELKCKEESFKDLEEKYYEASNDQANQKRSAALLRSLETQLKASDEVIFRMKKQIKELEEASNEKPSRKNKRTEAIYERQVMTSSDRDDSGPLLESHLTTEDKAEEIFQRSRSTRANLRRSLIVMPTTREETTASEEEATFEKTYSLRQRSERRRSFQPRRYMGGHTPPNKRTFIGDPAQARISMFSTTEPEEEPEVHTDWGLIANLQNEQAKIPLTEPTEEERLQELQRRNTLCLPHLKSSYPMELSVDKENHIPETILKDTHGKRKGEKEEGPRGTYKKWRTENSLSLSNDLSYLGRSTRSESSLRRDTMPLSSTETKPVETTESQAPAPQSCAFEITMDAPKKFRPNPRMTRSLASGNLKTSESTNESKARPAPHSVTAKASASNKEPATRVASTKTGSKGPVSRFHRGDGVRSSFKSATQKVAASFRGRKMNK